MEKPIFTLSIGGAFKLLLMMLIADLLASIALLPIALLSSTSLSNPLLDIPWSILSASLLIYWLYRTYALKLQALFHPSRFDGSFLLPMFITVLGASVVVSELSNYTLFLIPIPDFLSGMFDMLDPEKYGFAGVFISAAIVAPILEEILFRGIILGGLLHRYSPRMAVLASALIFAVAHANPWQFPVSFIMGILLGWWFLKTNSLILCISAHAFNNAWSYLLPLTALRIPGYTSDDVVNIQFQPWWFTLAGAFVLFAGVIWCRRCFSSSCRPEKNIANFDRSA